VEVYLRVVRVGLCGDLPVSGEGGVADPERGHDVGGAVWLAVTWWMDD
jgi:hypothetical protein